MSFDVPIPKVEESPEKDIGGVKRVKINETSIGERAGLTRTLAQAVLIINRLEVIALVSLGPVNIRQSGLQLFKHHGASSMSASAFEAEPEPG